MQENDVSKIIAEGIKNGKSYRFDFQTISDDEEFIKTVVAFSNTYGGRILFGVMDDGKIVGISDDVLFSKKDRITNSIVDSCMPTVVPDIFITTIDDFNIIVVDVVPGYNCPYYIKSEGMSHGTYVRVSGTSVPASPEIIDMLKLRGKRISYDSIEYPSVDVSTEKITELCRYLSSFNGEVNITNLINMGVIKETVSGYMVTNTFALLSNNPFPHARIQCAYFEDEKGLVFRDSKDFTGSIVSQVVDAINFVLKHLEMKSDIDGLVRIDHYEIPLNAIREAIINAVVHREYMLEGCSIFIRVFNDRVEIESPGLPLGLDMNDLESGRSVIRNQTIASVFKAIGFIERYGTGIRRMIDECKKNGVKEPEFKENGEFLRVTFRRNSKQSKHTYSELVLDRVLNLIIENPEITQVSMAKETGYSVSKVKRILHTLQDEGKITRDGNNRSGIWYINKH